MDRPGALPGCNRNHGHHRLSPACYRSDCIPCNLAAKRARTALDPQANRDRVRRWQQANRDRYRATQLEYKRRPERETVEREAYLKRKYGMTIADYERMFEAQRGVCAMRGSAAGRTDVARRS